jgi:hypothetical protein
MGAEYPRVPRSFRNRGDATEGGRVDGGRHLLCPVWAGPRLPTLPKPPATPTIPALWPPPPGSRWWGSSPSSGGGSFSLSEPPSGRNRTRERADARASRPDVRGRPGGKRTRGPAGLDSAGPPCGSLFPPARFSGGRHTPGFASAITSRFGSMTISIRRFRRRPSAVSFTATG